MKMNPVLTNPDMKISMSLDEIIYYTKEQINGQLQRTNQRGIRKKKKNLKSTNDVQDYHSVPLLGTASGASIYVSNHSPLLSPENKRRIAQAFSKRALNSNFFQKSKEIVPSGYKLLKTNNEVERVLVPAKNMVRPSWKKLSKPRKLNKNCSALDQNIVSNSLPDKPPPLVAAPIYKPITGLEMDVDKSDDEITIMDKPNFKKQLESIDVESDLADDILQTKKLCISAALSVPQMSMKTLNDRFTMLCGSLNF